MKKENVEYRYLPTDVVECRIDEQDDKRYLVGHASIFNSRSKMIFENGRLFYEIVNPRAFDNVLQDETLDVPMTYNHNRGQLLGRTKSGTLQLSKDEKGLLFRVEIPNTATGNEVYELVKRGDLYENSFAFVVSRDDEEWSKDEEGNAIRTIHNIQRLADVAVCINGAYANTEVAARSFEDFETEKDNSVKEAEEAAKRAEQIKEQKRIAKERAATKNKVLLEMMRMQSDLLKLKK